VSCSTVTDRPAVSNIQNTLWLTRAFQRHNLTCTVHRPTCYYFRIKNIDQLKVGQHPRRPQIWWRDAALLNLRRNRIILALVGSTTVNACMQSHYHQTTSTLTQSSSSTAQLKRPIARNQHLSHTSFNRVYCSFVHHATGHADETGVTSSHVSLHAKVRRIHLRSSVQSPTIRIIEVQ
jgi:hypothetical protein